MACREPLADPHLVVGLPSWFQAGRVLRYLGRDPESFTEQVVSRRPADGLVRLGLRVAGREVAVSVEIRKRSARCRLACAGGSPAKLPESLVAEVEVRLRRLLGLVIDPRPFERRAAQEPEVARLIAGRRGLSIPQTATVFDGLVWVVCGQQVSLPVAFALRRRLTERAGTRLDERLWAPASAAAVARLSLDDLRGLGFSRAKADYLSGIARQAASGALADDRLRECPPDALKELLGAVRGLGPWSVNYLMMRSFGQVDQVPVGDVALMRNLRRFYGLDARPGAAETGRLMAAFAPHRSLATFHLWALQEQSQ